MFNIVAVKNGQFYGTTDAIIGPQSSAFGMQPLPVDVGLNGIFVEIEVHIDQLITHHIHVTLQDCRCQMLQTLSRRLAD